MTATMQAAAECLGSRCCLYRAPPGTPSRILSLRLNRTANKSTRCFSQSHRLRAVPVSYTEDVHLDNMPLLSSDDIRVLHDVMQYKPQTRDSLGWKRLMEADEDVAAPKLPHWNHPKALAFLTALKKGATSDLFGLLAFTQTTAFRDTTVERQDFPIESVIARLPQTSFSEVLRCLDPFVVAKEVSAVDGISIGPGLAQMTPLGTFVDNFGIATVYVSLLRRLISVFELRRRSPHPPQFNDYLILIRCAGAASSVTTAKEIWQMMEQDKYHTWRSSRAYAEFSRARFLTEPLYMQYNLAQFRVRAAILFPRKGTSYMRKANSPWSRNLFKLGRLQRNMDLYRRHRFGQNVHNPQLAEDISWALRVPGPVLKVFNKVKSLGYDQDVEFLSTILIATARTGKVAAASQILRDYWDIHVKRNKGVGSITIEGGNIPRRDSPMYPTNRLLEAIVFAYCSNSHIVIALKLVNHISQRYRLQVHDKVWFDLLSWTYIAASRPVRTEWALMNMRHKVLRPSAVQLVWDAMVSEPYNVKPGFEQYSILINALIEERKYAQALPLMRELKEQYEAHCAVYEEALYEYSQTLQQGVRSGPALSRYERASAKKWQMWYSIQMWFHKIFKKVRPSDEDPFPTTTIPQLVDEFRNFMPSPVIYRTQTGIVHLQQTNAVRFVSLKRSVTMPVVPKEELSQRIDQGRWTVPRYQADLVRRAKGGSRRRWTRVQIRGDPFHRIRSVEPRVVSVKRPVTWTPDIQHVANGRLKPSTKSWLLREHT